MDLQNFPLLLLLLFPAISSNENYFATFNLIPAAKLNVFPHLGNFYLYDPSLLRLNAIAMNKIILTTMTTTMTMKEGTSKSLKMGTHYTYAQKGIRYLPTTYT